uniref:VLIG-type G domain-containing protein n=1 Tax=Rhabditophanes sp. KR3021 TaxID=114890 RepID=A0AC35UBD1_9BILA
MGKRKATKAVSNNDASVESEMEEPVTAESDADQPLTVESDANETQMDHSFFSRQLTYTDTITKLIDTFKISSFVERIHTLLDEPVPQREKITLIRCIVFKQGYSGNSDNLTSIDSLETLSPNIIKVDPTDSSFCIASLSAQIISIAKDTYDVLGNVNTLREIKKITKGYEFGVFKNDNGVTEPICILVTQTELLHSQLLNKMINILFELKLPISLIMTVSTDFNTVFSKCSKEYFKYLDMKYIDGSNMVDDFSTVWDNIQYSWEKCDFFFDYQTIKAARKTFCLYSHSTKHIKSYVDLALNFHFAKVNKIGSIIERDSEFVLHKRVYCKAIKVFQEMIADIEKYKGKNACWEIAGMIDESGSFFDESVYGDICNEWATWKPEKWILFLGKMNEIRVRSEIESFSNYFNEFANRIVDLRNLEKRKEEYKKELAASSLAKSTKKMSSTELRFARKNMMEKTKNSDLYTQDKMEIFPIVKEFFKMALTRMKEAPGYETHYVELDKKVEQFINPPSDYAFQMILTEALKQELTTKRPYNLLDVPLAYDLIQSMSDKQVTRKYITVDSWKEKFVQDCNEGKVDDKGMRFEKAVVALKRLGIIKNLLFSMSKIEKPVVREESLTDSEVEIVDPKECGEKQSFEDDEDDKKSVKSNRSNKSNKSNRSNRSSKSNKSGHLSDSNAESDDDEEETEVDTEEEHEYEDEEEAPIEECESDKYYGKDAKHTAILNLIYYSVLMFVVPLSVMYLTYHYVFIGHYGYDTDTAAMYAGLCAAATVYLVILAFIREAYNEEKQAEIRKKELKSE